MEAGAHIRGSSSHMNVKLYLVALIASIMLCGCTDFSALRNYDKSGEAQYDRIPLASGSEHEQAQRFSPLNQGNCLVYVVRKTDWYTSVSKASVLLSPVEPPMLPAELFSKYADQILTITSTEFVGNVYAMWELPSNRYLVTAVFNRNYQEFIGGWRRDLFEKSKQPGAELNWFQRHQVKLYMAYFAQAEIDCRPGVVRFMAVGDRGANDNIVLEELTDANGKKYIQNGVRSIGR